jgi:crotonobetainyl-CoA:carnitine CoA-transferase CaiB-like acyl-CoA transferase
MLIEVDDEELGPVLQHNVMWRLSASPGRIRFTGRALGQDTDEVLAELGYSPSDIIELKKSEAVR